MILFDEIIFGPVMSRRLGVSLGINLLPENKKYCNFNCIYCECGLSYNTSVTGSKLPSAENVKQKLLEKLSQMKEEGQKLNAITFAGNGEPTIHPEFSGIIDNTIEARNAYYPEALVSVLSNATMLANENIFNALQKTDRNILKLDSAVESTFLKINRPASSVNIYKIIDNLKKFNGDFYLQTMFLKGIIDGEKIDNTTDEEIAAWLNILQVVRPKHVQIYSIHRTPPYASIEIISKQELEKIAEKVRNLGIEVLTV